MTTDDIEPDLGELLTDAVAAAEKTKERLKSDPDAVRKLLTNTVLVEDDVTVYPSKVLNLEFGKLQARLLELSKDAARIPGESDEDFLERVEPKKAELERISAETDLLRAKLEESSVTFHLVSVPKKAIKNLRNAARKRFPVALDPDADALERQAANEEMEDYFQASIVAAHLVADGYTIEDMLNIQSEWPTRCWAQLWTTATRMSISDDYLGNILDADFS